MEPEALVKLEEEQAPTRQERQGNFLTLTPVMDVRFAKARLAEFQEFVRGYLVDGEDYGLIPGIPKPTLLKPGADKLCEVYGLADTYEILNRVEDWDRNLFDYEIKCTLTSKRDGSMVSTGLGSCNSFEGKYRWRDAQRKCPHCGSEAIIKGRPEYGGGWLCFAKKGGCGAKFPDGSVEIESQQAGKVENDDIPTLKNTILQMAKKRAKIDATLAVTRSSGIFTQDIEDFSRGSESFPLTHLEFQFENAFSKTKGVVKGLLSSSVFTEEEREQIDQELNQISRSLADLDGLIRRMEQVVKHRSWTDKRPRRGSDEKGIRKATDFTTVPGLRKTRSRDSV
jgi:hypothetical protein